MAQVDPDSEPDQQLLHGFCSLLHLSPDRVDLDRNFIANGGDSLLAIKFRNFAQSVVEAVNLSVGSILQADSVYKLVNREHLRQLGAGSRAANGNIGGNGAVIDDGGREETKAKSLPKQTTNGDAESSLENGSNAGHPTISIPNLVDNGHIAKSTIDANPSDVDFPITELQMVMFLAANMIPGVAGEHLTLHCYTDVLPKLREAFRSVVMQEDIFSLHLAMQDTGAVKATLLQETPFNWVEVKMDTSDTGAVNELFQKWGYETSQGPLFRVIVPSESGDTAVGERSLSTLHLFFNHAWLDGISVNIILERIDALMSDSPNPLPAPTSSLKTYQNLAAYRQQHQERAKSYWSQWAKEQPQDQPEPPPGILERIVQPLLCPMPMKFQMASISVYYPASPKAFSSETGYSFETLVRSAWSLVLGKMQVRSKVTFMSTNSRRSLPVDGMDGVVGCTANLLPMSVELRARDSALDLLSQVFDKMVRLDDVAHSEASDGFPMTGSSMISTDLEPHSPWYTGGQETKIAMNQDVVVLYVGKDGRVRLTFNSLTYSDEEMKIAAQLLQVSMISLGSARQDVGTCLVNMLPSSQRFQLLNWGNALSSGFPLEGYHQDIVSLFETHAASSQNSIALHTTSKQISYSELANMVTIVARELAAAHFEPGSVILVHADGSVNWIVAILAVLRVGCVVSSQSITLPHLVRSENFAAAHAKGFLVPQENDSVPTPDGCQVRLCVASILSQYATSQAGLQSTTAKLPPYPSPLSVAYICFTSGSMGKPKGVKCTHIGVTALLRDPAARLFAEPGHCVAQNLAPAFDGAMLEVCAALCFGATLILKDKAEPFKHLELADSTIMTPSLAAELNPKDFPNLKHVYLASEILPQHVADTWAESLPNVYNLYGPTECTMVSCYQRLTPGEPVTIGKPFPATCIYLLDDAKNLVPPLAVGEIHISGVQVSQGYVALPDETKERFIKDTIWPTDSGRMYATGDWGYWNLNGEIVFMGRKDRQVKLAGFRISLDDVQARLDQILLPQSSRSAVVVKNGALACLMLKSPQVVEEDVRQTAEATLPPHCVPKIFGFADKLPTNPYGKLDYEAAAGLIPETA